MNRTLGPPVRRAGAVTTVALVAVGLLAVAPATAAADEDELIVNGGFEDGLEPWFANNGNPTDTAELSLTDDAFSGNSAVLVEERGTTGSGPMQDLSGKLQAGETYALSARIKYDDPAAPATKQFFMTIHYGGGSYTNMGSVVAQRGEWALIEGTFTVPASQAVGTTRVFLETPWTADPQADPDLHLMDFVVDDVSLTGAPPPPPASRTVEVVGKLPGDSNPLISHKFGADGFGMVAGDRVFMYMTNDTQGYAPDPETGVSPGINYGDINQITVISSEDLVNWTDHGEIPVAGPNGIAPYTNNSWAPGAVQKEVDGELKTFLYYANGGGSSNVIVGDSPLGPWSDPRDDTLIDGGTPGAQDVAWKFDPAPFVDPADGQPYLYFGGGPASTSLPAAERFNNPKNMRGIELADNMIETEGTAFVLDTPVSFEAPHVFERNGLYYLTYSSHFGGNDFGGNQQPLPGYPGGGQIPYLISDDPASWPKEAYGGVLFPNQSQFFGAGTGGNNHQSVFELGGEYYFTHHAPTLNKRINGDQTQGYRSPHIEKLQFNDDGTIQQVVGTYEGVDQVKPLEVYGGVLEAETIAWRQGLTTRQVEGSSAQFGEGTPNLVLTDIDAGDWTSLAQVDLGEGAESLTMRVMTMAAGGAVEVRLDDREGPVVATAALDGPVGEWSEATADLTGVQGVHDVYLTFTGPEGEDLMEVDTYTFAAAEEEPEEPEYGTDTSLGDVLGADTSGPENPRVADGSDFDLLSFAVQRVLEQRPDSPVAVLADAEQPLTAFLPDDDAFVASLEAALRGRVPNEKAAAGRLRSSFSSAELEQVLLDHVVVGATLTSEQVLASDGAELQTAGGSTLTVEVDGGTVRLLDADGDTVATVTDVDVNLGQVQVAHVIDRVLLLG
ncbi:family 43 glycosylhydrolase [Aquipuribacter sp. SD81]|uniref:family 43 glycosylhydrolase n=1 Tax=Aquipuribacter sp. SD81 TaxID=3127703 RepID=UPI0030163556